MLSSELKSKINQLWDMFWSRGLSNPIQAIEQMSYLLFMRRLDQMDTEEIEKHQFSGTAYESIFDGDWDTGKIDGEKKPILIPKEELRWTNFKERETQDKYDHVKENVFPFIKSLNPKKSQFSKHMENAVFLIPSPNLLEDAIKSIDDIFKYIQSDRNKGQEFQDTQGDVYEYLLSELKESGKNGQFRTPRHLIRFLVEIIDPDRNDRICDPASGTGGFLLSAYQYILAKHTSEKDLIEDEDGFYHGKGDKIKDPKYWEKLWDDTFFGFDIDPTMVRIGLMNLMLHGIKVPHIENADTLSKKYEDRFQDGAYSVVLANPPFTGKISKTEKSDQFRVNTNSTELLFVDRIMKMLQTGGKGGVIIPEGVLFGSSKANKQLRELLLKDCQLEAVISLPSGVFKPYTGVKTAILIFTKAQQGSQQFHTEKVWFYQLQSDGYSLDDNRRRLKDKPLPEAVQLWKERAEKSTTEERKGQHFFVPLEEIKENDYDLSFNRYKEFFYEEQRYDPPKKILEALMALEKEILRDMEELNDLVG
ncbi:type I restriction-modification system subunit M [uncultured Algoriphagus sp.]|uniref:type I restriction-modification system subunit M n=1 Tax=uncultured Algoriphagus sp. TaxID=417365 RepID=UPI00259867A4|nr:type I restriction-modification system subunit M [uncultured Algoriphagus sp.]